MDVFDEINCEINEQMEICAANSSIETAIEVLAFSVDSARFRLNYANSGDFDKDSDCVSISHFNFRNCFVRYLYTNSEIVLTSDPGYFCQVSGFLF